MAFKQKLEHRQKLAFSQTLQQSVKILELPLLELRTVIETQLVENPVIEEVAAPTIVAGAPEPAAPNTREDEFPLTFDKEGVTTESEAFEKPLPAKSESLTDFLLKQLRINAKDENQVRLGTLLIQKIDENGYLREDPATIGQETQASQEELLETLRLIQTFEPYGVGARDLKECLLIQLKKKPEINNLALQLVENHLPELADKDLSRLRKKLGCAQEELQSCLAKIHALEPKPGRGFTNDEIAYVIPDITIEEKDNELSIAVKENTLPVIRVNPIYKNMLKSKKVNEAAKEFIRIRIANANNLMRAIQNRKNTLAKVVELIAAIQKEALLEGFEKINPLTLKDIAQAAGLHESTVSRVVANKYVQAPAGIFALKDLFSTSFKTSEGEDIAAERIKSKIRELIETEDSAKPYKDHELVTLIENSQNTRLARRTIAKYREALRIPPASQRRH